MDENSQLKAENTELKQLLSNKKTPLIEESPTQQFNISKEDIQDIDKEEILRAIEESDEKIKELEEENKDLETLINAREAQVVNQDEIIEEQDNRINELEAENKEVEDLV